MKQWFYGALQNFLKVSGKYMKTMKIPGLKKTKQIKVDSTTANANFNDSLFNDVLLFSCDFM